MINVRRTTLTLALCALLAVTSVLWQAPRPALAAGPVAVSAGAEHTCALTNAGGVQCWGFNGFRQLGVAGSDGSCIPYECWTAPQTVNVGSPVAAIAAGGDHTCALTTAGAVKCWGYNRYRQLGVTGSDGSCAYDCFSAPQTVNVGSPVAAIAAGGSHTCALTTAGAVKCWGLNILVELGVAGSDGSCAGGVACWTAPQTVNVGSPVAAIAAGGEHTCALTTAGAVKCWGWNYDHELGVAGSDGTCGGTGSECWTAPQTVNVGSPVAAIAAGGEHTCALTTAGAVKCWGYNEYHQLGVTGSDGSCANLCWTAPQTVNLGGGVTAAAVSLGYFHTCALTTSGAVKCWGYNEAHQLGVIGTDGTCTYACWTAPQAVNLGSGVTAAAISAGGYHTCALTTAGAVKCWGGNAEHELGVAGSDGTCGQYVCWTAPQTVPTYAGKSTNTPSNAPCSSATPWTSAVVVNVGGGITVSFKCVTSPGITTVATSTQAPGLPDGYRLNDGRQFFDITTTASYDGGTALNPGIEVCAQYYTATAPLVQHYSGAWLAGASFNKTNPNRACGRFTSLSPFALPELLAPKIAFSSDRGGDYEVYTMNADGTDAVNLTNDPGGDNQPAWSPDGTKIAFVSDRDGGDLEIYKMNADGTGQTRLTNSAGVDIEPAWSPDGTKIAFSSYRDGTTEIYSMNADGSNQTRLTPLANGAFDGGPAWSPDGTKIAFHSDSAGDPYVYVMNADGSGRTQLTNGPFDFGPAWSPDGTKIAFTSYHDGNGEIYTINADGSNQTNRSNSGANDYHPSWSADSARIAFESDRDGNPEIYTMNADGSSQTNITNDSADDTWPNWRRITIPGVDADLDGCTDQKEAGPNQAQGGRRNPFSFWDFMDQFTGGTRDRVVSGGDIGAVVARYGSVGDPNGSPTDPPTATTGYHTIADRNGSIPGQNAWNLKPPNGSVSGGDIGAIVAQFGHSCM